MNRCGRSVQLGSLSSISLRSLAQRGARSTAISPSGGPLERQRPQRSKHRVLASYEAYLQQRWAEGCRNRSRLFREIRLLGYQHSARTVSHFLTRLEQNPSASVAASSRPTVARVPSARHVACLLVWRKDQLPEEDREYLRRLCDHEPTIALPYELAQEFAEMAR